MKKALLKAFAIALAIPIAFMVVQVAMYEGMSAYNLPITPLYDGKPHYLFEYAYRALRLYPDIRNTIAVAAVRFIASYAIIHGRGKRGLIEAILSPLLARVLLMLYIVYRGDMSLTITIPDSLYVPGIGILGGLLSVAISSIRKPKPIFEKLKEAGFRFEPHRLAHVEPPIRCPYCGAEIHSNADVCRRCGRSLKEFYIEKIPEELRKYAFSRISRRV